jgi:SAM-dependent methyltransferase
MPVAQTHLVGVQSLSGSDVIGTISPRDEMHVGDSEHYFRVGASALQCISLALEAANVGDPATILDLPCGHGRVMRFLKAAFPAAVLTACDLEPDAVDFCAKTFGAASLYSTEDPRTLELGGPFDLIWCGSLLTHLDETGWMRFLGVFEAALSERGVLLFTTNGPYTRRMLSIATRVSELDEPTDDGSPPSEEETRIREAWQYFPLPQPSQEQMLRDYDASGFGYADYAESKGYGLSISSPSWACAQLESFAGLRIVQYIEEGWDSRQDVVACARRTGRF